MGFGSSAQKTLRLRGVGWEVLGSQQREILGSRLQGGGQPGVLGDKCAQSVPGEGEASFQFSQALKALLEAGFQVRTRQDGSDL